MDAYERVLGLCGVDNVLFDAQLVGARRRGLAWIDQPPNAASYDRSSRLKGSSASYDGLESALVVAAAAAAGCVVHVGDAARLVGARGVE